MKIFTKVHFLIILFFNYAIVFSQESTKSESPFKFSGYIEAYYGYDRENPHNHERPNIMYNFKRHNELNLNLAMGKVHYNQDNVRGTVGLMVGNYPHYNLIAEPAWAQFIHEANVGVKLSKTKNLWLDAGIFISHIGFETGLGAECYTLTRSIIADNSPYYETGLRLTYTNPSEKLMTAFYLLNGWQRIRRPDGHQNPSAGMQISYKPTSTLTLNYSNFIGSDKPDVAKAIRTFHNFYAIFEPNSTWGFIAGLDIGRDKYDANNYATCYGTSLIGRYAVTPKSKIAARVEYYSDPKQNYITTNTPNGFQTFGYSVNYDYYILKNVMFRNEVKYYDSKDPIFVKGTNEMVKQNLSFTTSLSFKF